MPTPVTDTFDPDTGLPDGHALLRDLDTRAPVPRTVELLALLAGDGLPEPLLLEEDSRLPGRIGQALRDVAALRDGRAYRFEGNVYAIVTPATPIAGPLAPVAQVAIADIAPHLGRRVTYAHCEVAAAGGEGRAALRTALARLRVRTSRLPLSPGRQARDVLLQMLDERHIAGPGPARASIASHAVVVGRALGLPSDDIDVLVRAAELQDVGLLTLPDDVLLKRDRLTDEEWALVREHSLAGERVIGAAPALARVGRIVRSCYERFDGTGYPDGLRADEIPIGSRIIAVCVAYHAMTSPRSYRAARSPMGALAELRACAGSQFDPRVVAAFCALAGESRSAAREAA